MYTCVFRGYVQYNTKQPSHKLIIHICTLLNKLLIIALNVEKTNNTHMYMYTCVYSTMNMCTIKKYENMGV